ncbi:dimethyladenosine transferase 2, mitochondrial [Ixodes scapularis]
MHVGKHSAPSSPGCEQRSVSKSGVPGMLMESIGTMADLDDAVLFEANPGPGILTRCLLKSGVPHLRVFEKNPLFLKELEGLKQRYPSQLEVVEEDLLRLPTLQACDSYGITSRVDALLRGLPPQAWKEPPCLLVIASLSRKRELSFLRFLLHVLPQRASLFAIGRIDFLLFLTETEYTYLSASNSDHNFKKYRDVSILYKLFFDIEVLGKVCVLCSFFCDLPCSVGNRFDAQQTCRHRDMYRASSLDLRTVKEARNICAWTLKLSSQYHRMCILPVEIFSCSRIPAKNATNPIASVHGGCVCRRQN